MKLFISENIDKSLQGYTIIPIIYGEIDISNVPNNSATSIIAIDALDSIKYDKIVEFLRSVISKMRIGCILHLGGIDIYALSRELLNGSKDIEECNKELYSNSGIYSSKFISDILYENKLKIKSIVYKGNRYEISATRPENKN